MLLLVAALFVRRELMVAGAPGAPLDDTWIHFQFARNLAEGRGLSYNPGELTAGATSPLWVVMLALAYRASGEFVWTAKALGVAFYLANCLLAYALVWRVTRTRWAAWAAGAALAVTSQLAWGALSGMEVQLALAVALAGLLAHVGGRSWLATLLFGLATLARPEAVVLFAAARIDDLLRVALGIMDRPGLGRLLAAQLGHAALLAVVLAPALWFNWTTAGHLLPNTFYSKVGGSPPYAMLDWRRPETLAAYLGSVPGAFVMRVLTHAAHDRPVLFFVLPFGLWDWAVSAWRRDSTRGLVIPLSFLLYPWAMGLVGAYWGPDFQHGRYLATPTALSVIIAATALPAAARFARERMEQVAERSYPAVEPAIATVLLALLLLPPTWDLPHRAQTYAINVKNINEMQVHLGLWARAHLPADSVLAVNDIGAITFYSGHRIIDLTGLVTPEVVAYSGPWWDRQGRLLEYLQQVRPDYLIIFPDWYPRLAELPERFSEIYRVELSDNTIAGADTMVVFRALW